jgi:pimeloyl-ACP methyl ester carboxylesterase
VGPVTFRAGQGAPVLLIHGSAADHQTWAIQLVTGLLPDHELIAYDRPLVPLAEARLAAHAADAAAVLEPLGRPALVIGSSFGGIIALELARARPALVRAVVACEPPLPVVPEVSAAAAAFPAEFDAIAARDGGPAAGAAFMRMVLGEQAYGRLPARMATKCCGMWQEIRSDSEAIAALVEQPLALESIAAPVLLLGGDRSPPVFAAVLAVIEGRLPHATRRLLPGAGHMMHAEAPRAFAAAVREFVAELPAS